MTNFPISIKVKEQPIAFDYAITHIGIDSRYDTHHTFEIHLSIDLSENITPSTIAEYLGNPLSISYGKGVFRGFIDEIIAQTGAQNQKTLTIKGFSPTVFLEGGVAFQCFAETTLEDIIKTILRPYQSLLPSVNVAANTTIPISWAVQTQESDYGFLSRLADQSAHFEFFYDGKTLHFANLTAQSPSASVIKLTQGKDLYHVGLNFNTAPLSFSVRSYDYVNEAFPTATLNVSHHTNPLLEKVLEASKVYPKQDIVLPYGVSDKQSLNTVTRRFASQQAHTLLVLQGGSYNSALAVGSKIKLEVKDNNMFDSELEETDWVITHIHHSIEQSRYYNTFQAVPVGHPYNLRMNVSSPMSAPMVAEVVDNNDPAQLGRVRVRFLMDKRQAISPWIRCLTPYTSGGGAFFVPDKKEWVMVAAEDFNLEKGAFVLNSFFYKSKNAKKWSLSERGFEWQGNRVSFSEEQGKIQGKKVVIKAEGDAKVKANKIFLN